MEVNEAFPAAAELVGSPLQNRISLELDTSVNQVWAIVGDPAKILVYSSGLSKIETKTDPSGKCTAYTCYYQTGENTEETIHSKILRYKANTGWASLDDEPNAFGFQQSLALITVRQTEEGKTALNWSMHYNHQSRETLQMYITSLDQALKEEIAPQLIQQFGGRIIESYIYNKSV